MGKGDSEIKYSSIEEHLAILNSNELMESFVLTLTQTLQERLFPNKKDRPTTDDPDRYGGNESEADHYVFARETSGLDFDEIKEKYGDAKDSEGNEIFPTESEIHQMIEDTITAELDERLEQQDHKHI